MNEDKKSDKRMQYVIYRYNKIHHVVTCSFLCISWKDQEVQRGTAWVWNRINKRGDHRLKADGKPLFGKTLKCVTEYAQRIVTLSGNK
jgi:hypothetical protein